MATVRPFRALRYDEAKAGPLETLIAPPYDVVSDAERATYLARSPYNVVHLTLPDSEEQAARDFRAWQEDGVLRREDEPSFWWLAQDYVGPDGVARTREGLVASLRLEPYENRVVLPHERTHAGPKEGRLRLLRAVRAQLEPLFFLYPGSLSAGHAGDPDLEATEGGVTSRLWRVRDESLVEKLADAQLLIADGHHRYETALAFHEEDGTDASAWLLAVVVPTAQAGLTIFPTHRLFRVNPRPPSAQVGHEWRDGPREALAELQTLPHERPAAVAYENGRTELVRGPDQELDVFMVDRLGHDGISYTPSWEDAVKRVDSGEAAVAYLLRPTRIEDVFRLAEHGEVMPQKSTYFFPKLTSGLLFHPL
jgi:uncharacterized protein (DUF1015 family)